jgi:carbamoyltransferase
MLLGAPVQEARRGSVSTEEQALFGIDRLKIARSDIPAVTHVDFSARVQTVNKEDAPRYHQLLEAFKRRTGYGVFVNTSFNVRGEPIVCTPQDAYLCFMRTDMDVLVLEDMILLATDQPSLGDDEDWRLRYELD